MSEIAPRRGYSSVSILLHWFMLVVLVGVYTCMEVREGYPKGSDFREGLKTWHYILGLSVLLLVFVRIGVRMSSDTPPISPPPPDWQMLLAKLMHFALYAFLVVMPVAGWVMLSASGKAIPFFGAQLPALVAPDPALAGQVKEFHETVATIGYFLAGFHALAGLFHHYVVKDNTLRRMMPGAR